MENKYKRKKLKYLEKKHGHMIKKFEKQEEVSCEFNCIYLVLYVHHIAL